MEEGEIASSGTPDVCSTPEPIRPSPSNGPFIDTSGATHYPSLEWPGDTDTVPDFFPTETSQEPRGVSISPSPSSSLRLRVQRSAILRKHQTLALLDGYSEIDIGRDLAPAGSDTPRIRLKEMEVSKLHATIYWDQDRSQWAIVDMGSKHGTFVHSPSMPVPSVSALDTAEETGVRLSAPRVASMPRALQHLDCLTIGGTTFIVHVHSDDLPCTTCSPRGNDEIPLFLHRTAHGDPGTSKKRKVDIPPAETFPSHSQERNPKKALASLKRSLLSANAVERISSPHRLQYVDRSARRRALHPDRAPAAVTTVNTPERTSPPSLTTATPPPIVTSQPPSGPLPTTNVGHQLLMKQGWVPGSALGMPSSENSGLVEPLSPPSAIGRAGIGVPVRTPSSVAATQDGNWKDEGRRRRWAELRTNGGNP